MRIAAPSPRTNPSRLPLKRPRGRLGAVVAPRQRRQPVEARDAQRVNHGVGPAGDHHVGLAPADQHHGLADRLRAGGTGRQATARRPPGPGQQRDVGGGHVGLLLQLVVGLHPCEGQPCARLPCHRLPLRVPAGEDAGEEGLVVEGAFAGAEIDAHARAVDDRPPARRFRRRCPPAGRPAPPPRRQTRNPGWLSYAAPAGGRAIGRS